MVGDQVFADILAGRLAGLKTILVDPIHPEEEPWFTRLKRPPERWVLRRTAVPVLPPQLPVGSGGKGASGRTSAPPPGNSVPENR